MLQTRRSTLLLFACTGAALLAARLCHVGILWSDEDYHLAAAIQALYGKIPYRDLWYDKPPLNIAANLLFAARSGWILRVASAVYALGLCGLAYRFAGALWGGREAAWAAALTGFYLIFYFPGSTITLEPDTLMMVPHLGAVYLAWRNRPLYAGIAAGIATLFNVKGLFVLASCAVFCFSGLPMLALGFAIPNALALGWLGAAGALPGYWQQVWVWGFLYAKSPDPVSAGLTRAVNWIGFHAALAIGAAFCLSRAGDSRIRFSRIKFSLWLLISLMGAGVGWRFVPRYLDGVLPPLLILGAGGIAQLVADRRRILVAVAAIALVVAVVRFGPRYIILAREAVLGNPQPWSDTAMDRDSQTAALLIRSMARSGDTLFIWGYRPNIVVYTRMPVASRLWDSQAVTGVPADRHLSSDVPVVADLAARNRQELASTKPEFIADGLSFFNPKLDIHRFGELNSWLKNYCVVGKTAMTTVYRRCALAR